MKNNAPSLPVPTESVEQQCLFRWAAFQSGRFPELALLYHVPNGGSRKKAEAGRFRAEGVGDQIFLGGLFSVAFKDNLPVAYHQNPVRHPQDFRQL